MSGCNWREPGATIVRCGKPAVVRAIRFETFRCRRHSPPRPWDPAVWEAIPEPPPEQENLR